MNPIIPAFLPMALAAILFCIGLFTVMVRRSLIFMLLGIEVMFNAAGLLFIFVSGLRHDMDGQIMFLIILVAAAAEVAVALALALLVQRRKHTLDSDDLTDLRG